MAIDVHFWDCLVFTVSRCLLYLKCDCFCSSVQGSHLLISCRPIDSTIPSLDPCSRLLNSWTWTCKSRLVKLCDGCDNLQLYNLSDRLLCIFSLSILGVSPSVHVPNELLPILMVLVLILVLALTPLVTAPAVTAVMLWPPTMPPPDCLPVLDWIDD